MAESFKILIIEDEEALRTILRDKLLLDGNNSVEVASNGEIGLELLKKQSYDLVLLDLLMPGVDGYEVLRQVKQDGIFGLSKIVAVSNFSESDSKQKLADYPIRGYIVKADISLKELVERVEEYIQK